MNDYYRQIADHAHDVPDQEVCGFLFFDNAGSLRAERARNVANSPATRFELSDQAHLAARKQGGLAAYYHSHWNEGIKFSEEDIERSNTAQLPVFCYSTYTRSFNLHRPLSAMPAYKGRMFVLGFQDCASIVTDYYSRERAFHLPYFARPGFMLVNGFPDLKAYLSFNGFVMVEREDYQEGDVLAFCIAAPNNVPNHVGIYLGDNVLLHQVSGTLSSTTSMFPSWSSRVQFAMRLKNT